MLKQKQALEPVRSSSHPKNSKSFLVSSFIKSKFYFLILLTVTTGGIVLGNITVPELVPPAQSQEVYLSTEQLLAAGGSVIRINDDGWVYLRCTSPSAYGRVSGGVVVRSTINGRWANTKRIYYGETNTLWVEDGGRYQIGRIDAEGNLIGETIVGAFQY